MEEFALYQYYINSAKELLDILMLRGRIKEIFTGTGQNECGGTIPDCDNGTVQFVKFYSAACGVWVKCSYTVDPNSRECEQGFDLPYPDYSAPGGIYKVDYWKWQSCGQTCCERTYTVCKKQDIGSSNIDLQIKNVSKRAIRPCSEDPQGNTPKYAKPCQDGC